MDEPPTRAQFNLLAMQFAAQNMVLGALVHRVALAHADPAAFLRDMQADLLRTTAAFAPRDASDPQRDAYTSALHSLITQFFAGLPPQG